LDDKWSSKAQAWSEDPQMLLHLGAYAHHAGKRMNRDEAQGIIHKIITAMVAGRATRTAAVRHLETTSTTAVLICLTVTLATAMRVAAIALVHRGSQESKETKVFTSVYVQSPDLNMPGNRFVSPQDRKPHEFLLPTQFVGRQIQLAFDGKKVAGNGEPPGLCGLLVYGHEPDAEINAQGGRNGHKKVKK
jgi:hypothetical protein